MQKIRNFCADVEDQKESRSQMGVICGIHWYDGSQGYTDINAPTLAICYRNGKCQLLRSELDEGSFFLYSSHFILWFE